MSTVVECAVCGRAFRYLRGDTCGDCTAQDDDAFRIVRAFLDEHPDTSIRATVEETGVSGGQIHRLVEQGRLRFAETPGEEPDEAERRRRIALRMAAAARPGTDASGEARNAGMRTRGRPG